MLLINGVVMHINIHTSILDNIHFIRPRIYPFKPRCGYEVWNYYELENAFGVVVKRRQIYIQLYYIQSWTRCKFKNVEFQIQN